jgi:hypothetical protein
MTTTRGSATLAFATTFVGASVLSGVLAMPLAHADGPRDNVIRAVFKDRNNTRCSNRLRYDDTLQDSAGAYATTEDPSTVQGAYNGQTVGFLGSGDPQAAAINSAYNRGAGSWLGKCEFTDFGVGFIRHDDRSVDVVTIVFGEPTPPANICHVTDKNGDTTCVPPPHTG